jgi:hypothetical protein
MCQTTGTEGKKVNAAQVWINDSYFNKLAEAGTVSEAAARAEAVEHQTATATDQATA